MMIRSNSVITVWLMTQTAGMLLLVPVLNAQSKPNAIARGCDIDSIERGRAKRR